MNTTNESAGGFPANGLTAAQCTTLIDEVGTFMYDAYGQERFMRLLTTLFYNYTRLIIHSQNTDNYVDIDEAEATTGMLMQLQTKFQAVVDAGKEVALC